MHQKGNLHEPRVNFVLFRTCELRGGQVVHDGDVDELLCVLHHTEDGLKVRSPARCTERRRGTLTGEGRENGNVRARRFRSAH